MKVCGYDRSCQFCSWDIKIAIKNFTSSCVSNMVYTIRGWYKLIEWIIHLVFMSIKYGLHSGWNKLNEGARGTDF